MLYLKSLAYRRLRKYTDAKNFLEKTIQSCDGEFKRKALYLNARIAAMTSTPKSLEVLDEFVSFFPNDDFTDDVLLWKAHVLKELNQEDEAGQVLDQVIQKNGDMREQALFERALQKASSGSLEEALNLLGRLNTPQGLYWKGRLMVHPEPATLKLNPDKRQRAEGKKNLRLLSKKMPSHYYGYFAASLLNQKTFSKPRFAKLPKNALLEADPVYQIMLCLKKAQNSQDAAWVLDRLARTHTSEPARFILAQHYIDLGRPDRAHQLMRMAGLAFPRFNGEPEFHWRLAFPKAYSAEFLSAAHKEKIPLDWITGLSREESQFDSQVISWAGAVGLCQLLPTTAHLKENELLKPEVNISAGAEHLRELHQELVHPLKAIAAYNAGKGAVKRWEKQNPKDIPMDYFVELIPYEQTRNYVKKVSSAWLTYAWLEGRLLPHFYSVQNNP